MTSDALGALSTMLIDPQVEPVFQEGDVAVIMRGDGTVKALSIGLDGSRLNTVPEDEWTEADHMAHRQGRKLLAVALAVANPMLLDVMHAVIDDPTIAEEINKLTRRH